MNSEGCKNQMTAGTGEKKEDTLSKLVFSLSLQSHFTFSPGSCLES